MPFASSPIDGSFIRHAILRHGHMTHGMWRPARWWIQVGLLRLMLRIVRGVAGPSPWGLIPPRQGCIPSMLHPGCYCPCCRHIFPVLHLMAKLLCHRLLMLQLMTKLIQWHLLLLLLHLLLQLATKQMH